MPFVSHIQRKPPPLKSQPHECNWPGCELMVKPDRWACRVHLAKLPSLIRHRLWATYRIGQDIGEAPLTPEYEEAERAAQEWASAN